MSTFTQLPERKIKILNYKDSLHQTLLEEAREINVFEKSIAKKRSSGTDKLISFQLNFKNFDEDISKIVYESFSNNLTYSCHTVFKDRRIYLQEKGDSKKRRIVKTAKLNKQIYFYQLISGSILKRNEQVFHVLLEEAVINKKKKNYILEVRQDIRRVQITDYPYICIDNKALFFSKAFNHVPIKCEYSILSEY